MGQLGPGDANSLSYLRLSPTDLLITPPYNMTVSFCFLKFLFEIFFNSKDEFETCHGENFEDVVEFLNKSSELAAIGINCSNATKISGLLVAARNSKKPLVIYPNRWGDESQKR